MRDSFVDLLRAYGEQYPPSLLYKSDTDFKKWQNAFSKKIHALLGPLPKRTAAIPEILETTKAPDHIRILIRLQVSTISTLAAYLLLPSDLTPGERRPALLALHGHAENGMDDICGVIDHPALPHKAYGLHAVRAGYIVLCPAWWGWKGRDGHRDLIEARDKCNVIQMAAAMYGINVTALHIQDTQAALDILAARPEVEASRIGVIGNSYGGRSTMWAALFDNRIKACVAAGCMNTFRERSLKLSSCGIQYLPGILQYGDVPELFSLIAPRALQLHAGEKDDLITPADREAILNTVRTAYQRLGADDKLDYVLHPEGHLLRWDLAEPFLKSHLGWQA